MAVEIELELDASSALGEIGAVSLALENLDKKFDDLADMDLDLGDIGEEMRNMLDSLDDVEKRLNNITSDIEQAAQELDGATIGIETPDGATGDGDSTGNDPPRTVSIDHTGILPDGVADGGEDGSEPMSPREFTQKMDSLFGTRKGVFMGEGTVPQMNRVGEGFSGGNPVGRSMYEVDSLRDDRRLATDAGFGTESLSMARKRIQQLTEDELQDVLDYTPGDAGFDVGSSGDRGGMFSGFSSQDLKEFKSRNPLGGLTKRLRKLKPSMSQYLNLLAALIPMMATFAMQAAGAAAALGGVAVAGGSIMALGLVGHGSNMADSWRQAGQELQNLKKELYDTFQPTMQMFAPMQANFFDWVPGELQGISEEMEGLMKYEDTFYNLFSISTSSIEDFFAYLSENEAAISEMATAVTRIGLDSLGDALTWIVRVAYENWGMMMQLGTAFKQFGIITYNVVRAASAIVLTFMPLLDIIANLSGLLNNKVVLGLLTFAGTALMTAKVVSSLSFAVMGLYARLMALGSGSLIQGVVRGLLLIQANVARLIAQYTALSGAAASAAAAMALTGVGALAVGAGAIAAGGIMSQDFGGGPSGSGSFGSGYGGGQQVVYNDNRSYTYESKGSDDFASQEAAFGQFDEWEGTTSSMEPPSPGTDTESSTSGDDTDGDN